MSSSTRAREGVAVFKCRSISAIVEWIMKSSPLGIPMPNWPCGSRCSAASLLRIVMARAAVIRRSAEPIPSGRVLSRSFGSLCNARK
jgi:hypothetical protein